MIMRAPGDQRRRTLFLSLIAVVAALPAALAAEALGRRALPASLDDLRNYLAAGATRAAWVCVGLTLIGGWGAWLLQRWFRARLDAEPGGPTLMAEVEKLMISASVAQTAPLCAVAAYFLGAELAPVLLAIAIATVAVLSLWFAARA